MVRCREFPPHLEVPVPKGSDVGPQNCTLKTTKMGNSMSCAFYHN